MVDKIYSTRENRRKLKEKGINLIGKPLRRPSLAAQIVLSPGERNLIEGKFTHDFISILVFVMCFAVDQAKTGYGLDRVKARLQDTSELWIASIILVFNLVKLSGVALHWLLVLIMNSLSACFLLKINENENRCDLNQNHTYELALL